MDRSLRTRSYRTAAAFLVAAGVVLTVLAAALAFREMVAPPRDTWLAWTGGTIVVLSLLAIFLWLVGGLLSRHAHRKQRDTARTFLTPDERMRVVNAIRGFETRTSGEIRVHIEERTDDSSTRAAARTFERLGMTRTRDRNGVLFFVSVRDRRFAVVGDVGIHAVVPEGFWASVATRVESRFGEGRFADGLVDGIAAAGEALASSFPPHPGDINELPDTISES